MAASVETPTHVGRYRVLRRLGAGGMAEVFLAKSAGAEGVEKVLVVKRILPRFSRAERLVAMFVDEAKVAMRLNHPNIVQVYAFEQVGDDLVLAMEYVDGLDLGRLSSATRSLGERFPPSLAAYVASELARGLDYAHRRRDERGESMDIVHRDVSPQNALIAYDGAVKLTDFGIAKARDVSEDEGTIKGKLNYMSPEQARGDRVDRRSDVYSLGVLLGELLLGRSIRGGFRGAELLDVVRRGELPGLAEPGPHVPEALRPIVERATAHDPALRYPTMRALGAELARYLRSLDEIIDAHTLERFVERVAPKGAIMEAEPIRSAETFETREGRLDGSAERRERVRVMAMSGWVRSNALASEPAVGRVLEEMAFKAQAVLRRSGARFRLLLGLGGARASDPLAAATLALDLIEAIAAIAGGGDDAAPPVSIGLSRGWVVAVRDAEGKLLRHEPADGALEVADRLSEAAEASEILVSGEVYRLIRRDFVLVDAVSPVKLGGAPNTAEMTIGGYRLDRGRGLGERTAPRELAQWVARRKELDQIDRHLDELAAGRRTAPIAIRGEPGIGKSALVRALLGRARERGIARLLTECSYATADRPFGAIAELVRSAVDAELADPTAKAWIEGIATPIAAAIRGWLDGVNGAPDETGSLPQSAEHPVEVSRMIRTVLASRARKRGPVVIVIDAVEWADEATQDVLRGLLRSPPPGIWFVLSGRMTNDTTRLLRDLDTIDLEPLDGAAVRALLRAHLGEGSLPAELERALVDRAGGNPFFVVELVESLFERGVLRRVENDAIERVPGVPVVLPTTLEEAATGRLDELDDEERIAARWLAVVGAELPASALTAAGVHLEAPLRRLVERGVARRHDEGTYEFTSALFRHAAYASIDDVSRPAMHRAVAEAIRITADASPAALARHLERAGDTGRAADAYLEAAEAARSAGAFRDALRAYRQAIDLLPPNDARRVQAHAGRETIWRSLGEGPRGEEIAAIEAIAEARPELPRLRVTASLRRAALAIEEGDHATAAQAIATAAEMAGRDGHERTVGDTHLARAAHACAEGRYDDAEDAARRAWPKEQAPAARWLGEARLGRGNTADALDAFLDAVVLARRDGAEHEVALALEAASRALDKLGDLDGAALALEASIRRHRRTGERAHLGEKLARLASLAGRRGRPDREAELLGRAATLRAHPRG